MKNIIITGAAGMIGRAIVKEALSRNISVAAVVRENSPNIACLQELQNKNKLQIICCDCDSYNDLNFEQNYDAFIHLAWQKTDASSRDDADVHAANIIFTLDALQAAHRAGCSTFVFAGSQAEYGVVSEPLRSDTPCNPESAYGIAKYAAGKLATLVASQLGIRCCRARILSTYGEGLGDESVITYLIKNLLAGVSPSLTKCEQIWDFMYARDTAWAMLAIAERGADGKAYPVGSGAVRPLREYAEIIRDIIDPAIQLGFGEKEYYPHQPMYLCADISELHSDTGFAPSVSFDEGIRDTISWVRLR